MKPSLLLIVCVAAFHAACNGAPGSSPSDDGGTTHDSGSEDTGTPGTPWATAQLLSGDLQVDGLTTDGYLVYHDSSAFYAVDTHVTPAQPIKLLDAPEIQSYTAKAVVRGHVVFIKSDYLQTWHGTISTWSSLHPSAAPVQLTTNGLVDEWDASSDGSAIYYTTDLKLSAQEEAQALDLVLDKFDHSAPRTLVAQADLVNCDGSPSVGGFRSRPGGWFVGNTLVVNQCASGNTAPDLWTYDPATGSGTKRVDQIYDWMSNHGGTALFAETTSGARILVPVTGGMVASLSLPGYQFGHFTPDDSALIYWRYPSKSVRRYDLANGTGIDLQPAGTAAGVGAASPDGKWLTFRTKTASYGDDVWLASAEHADTPVALDATPNAGFLGTFTDDSRYLAMTLDPADSWDASTLSVWKITVADAVQIDTPAVAAVDAVGGANLVLADHYKNNQPLSEYADVRGVDLSKGTDPMLLHSQAYFPYVIAPDKKTLWFGSREGIYSTQLP